MLLISLDEQGDFENLGGNNDTKPMFIGGIIYDDKNRKADLDLEKKRIRLYLKAVCEEAGASYPQDLHVGNNNNGKVRLVKQKISETLPEFLKSGICRLSGSQESKDKSDELCRMTKRDGSYHIFALVKYGTDRKEFLRQNTSILVKEDYASNLYVHMAEDIVERMIFHNPVIESVEKVHLNLATRRVVLDEKELEGISLNEKAKQYIRLGYKEDEEHQEKGKRTFILTNKDLYRTAMEREMFDTGKKGIQVNQIEVKSIYYGHEKEEYTMEFLYMSDIICSVLGFKLNTNSVPEMIADMENRADTYAGHSNNLIFAYDAVDTIFKKAWHKLEEKEYFEALRCVYAGLKKDSPYREHYEKVWFPVLIERLKKETNAAAYGIALRKYYLLTKENNIDQSELVYLFERLEEMLGQMTLKDDDQKAFLYELYDAGISAYTHMGDSVKARECYEKCRGFAKYVEIERLLNTNNKLAVFLADMLFFEEAYEIAAENVDKQEKLLELKKEFFGQEEASKPYGRALSQLGQIYSFLHWTDAEKTFLNALEQFEDKNSKDYFQTTSYLLHYYAEMGMQKNAGQTEKENYKKAYCERAAGYFDGKDGLKEQFRVICREADKEAKDRTRVPGKSKGETARFTTKYALYFWIKGLYSFRFEQINSQLLKLLYQIENEIRESCTDQDAAESLLRNHPWEIIYKYLAFIAFKKGNEDQAEAFMKKSRQALTRNEFITEAICLSGEMEFAYVKQDENWKSILQELLALLQKNAAEVYQKVSEKETEEEQYWYLKENVFSYMYG